MIIEFDIFFLTADQVTLEDQGISVPFKDLDIKKVVFYNIDYVTPRTDEPNYTLIGSGGQEFTTNEKYETVLNRIQEASIFKFN